MRKTPMFHFSASYNSCCSCKKCLHKFPSPDSRYVEIFKCTYLDIWHTCTIHVCMHLHKLHVHICNLHTFLFTHLYILCTLHILFFINIIYNVSHNQWPIISLLIDKKKKMIDKGAIKELGVFFILQMII